MIDDCVYPMRASRVETEFRLESLFQREKEIGDLLSPSDYALLGMVGSAYPTKSVAS